MSRSFLKKKHPEACLGLSKIYDEVFLQKRLTAKNHYYRKMAPSNMFAKVSSTTVGFNSSDDKLYSKLTLTHSRSILHSYRNYSQVPIKCGVLISGEGGALGKIK